MSSTKRLVGRVLGGRYLVGQEVGSGAMGRVYRARHVELGRACAVKVIREAAGDGGEGPAVDEAAARFRVEALAASRLDHPNVLRVLDFGREADDGLLFLVTEHLDGEDLVDALHGGEALPTERIVAVARQICAALQHAHDHGVVHRDLKPENVRLVRREGDDGQVVELVKLLDFGTALIADVPAGAERLVIGTPAYMSPEQAAGEPVDGRCDVYAVGVLLFEMATGRLPFERSSAIALAAAHVECPPPAPSSVREAVDPELESVILWCLRKRPSERPQSARELRDALDRLSARSRARRSEEALAATARARASAAPPVFSPVCSTRRQAPVRRRRRAPWAAAAVAAAVVVLGVGGALRLRVPAGPAGEPGGHERLVLPAPALAAEERAQRPAEERAQRPAEEHALRVEAAAPPPPAATSCQAPLDAPLAPRPAVAATPVSDAPRDEATAKDPKRASLLRPVGLSTPPHPAPVPEHAVQADAGAPDAGRAGTPYVPLAPAPEPAAGLSALPPLPAPQAAPSSPSGHVLPDRRDAPRAAPPGPLASPAP